MHHLTLSRTQHTAAQRNIMSDRKRRIYHFLKSHPVGVLSTVTPSGEPHGVVIYFTIDEEFTVSFLTKNRTKKFDNLLHNDHVMLTVYEPLIQGTVQIIGRAKQITDSYRVNQVADDILAASLQTSDAGIPPISKLEAGDYVGFDITALQTRMAVYARPDPGDYSDIFESVESYDLKH